MHAWYRDDILHVNAVDSYLQTASYLSELLDRSSTRAVLPLPFALFPGTFGPRVWMLDCLMHACLRNMLHLIFPRIAVMLMLLHYIATKPKVY